MQPIRKSVDQRLIGRGVTALFALSLSALGSCATPSQDVPDNGTPDLASSQSVMQEKPLSIALSLVGTTLHITVQDGTTPVMTDVWLYTLENGVQKPLTAFMDPPTKRRSRRLMMPCTLSGSPSGLAPCDDGVENGVMTDLARETLAHGVYTPAIKGTVDIVLTAAPTSPILVVAAVEDERYAGAAAIGPDGKPVATPSGVGQPASHPARTYTKDIAPLVQKLCSGCHAKAAIAGLYQLGSYSDLVTRNFGFAEAQHDCQTKNPADGAAEMACEQAITKVEYMIERGAAAISSLARRCRPDEQQSVSPSGLLWYGSGNSRFGGTGDRRMPSTNTDPVTDMGPPPALPTYFDQHAADYQILFDWIAQGAPQ